VVGEIGNKKVRGHGLQVAFQSTKCILDPHVFFEQASELERAEKDVPDAIIDFSEAD